MTKTCKGCLETKKLEEFHYRNKKPISQCKCCVRKVNNDNYSKNRQKRKDYKKSYYLDNKEAISVDKIENYKKDPKKHIEASKVWYQNNKGRVRDLSLQRNYGIDLETYNEMFRKQEGKCATCSTHQSELKRSLCVDHDHETSEIRGLLCDSCNRSIGLLKENLKTISNVIVYLKKYGAKDE